jgi:hypothetical protein
MDKTIDFLHNVTTINSSHVGSSFATPVLDSRVNPKLEQH